MSLQLCLPNQVQDRTPKGLMPKARQSKRGVAEGTLELKLSGPNGSTWPSIGMPPHPDPAVNEGTVTWAALFITGLHTKRRLWGQGGDAPIPLLRVFFGAIPEEITSSYQCLHPV